MNIEIKIPFTHPRVEYSISSDTQGVQIVPSVQSGSQVPVPQITFPPSGTSTPAKRQSITSIASSTPETSTVTRTTQKRTSTERRYEVKPTLYQGYYITPSAQTSPQITVNTSGTATPLQVQHSPTSQPISPPKIANSERQASRVEYDNQRFSVTLDVSQYRPEDIEVKVKDNKLTVRAEHKEGSPETGYVQREYFRQYTLPEDVDVRLVKSYLSEDGMLSLDAPRLQLVDAGERVIPIQIRHQANDAGSLSPKGPFVEEVISDAESLRSAHKK